MFEIPNTITLKSSLKKRAKRLSLDVRRDLSYLIEDGLRLVLAQHRKGGRS